MLSTEQIETAVNWWADAIKRPKFDNGDNSDAGGMAMMLATLAHKAPSAEQIETFKKALADEMASNERIEKFGLNSDYGPDGNLAEAMQQAGINPDISSVPWKTNMHFSDGEVTVSCGYGADYVKLYPVAVGD